MKIDLSQVHTPEGKAEVVDQLKYAATDIGFFYLVGHGIPLNEIQEMFSLSKSFFELPEGIKNKTPFDAFDG